MEFNNKNLLTIPVDTIEIHSLIQQILKHQDIQKLLTQSTDITITSIITVITALVIQIIKIKGYIVENDVNTVIQKAKL